MVVYSNGWRMSSSATNDRAASGQTPAPGWRAESSCPRCKVPRGGEGAVAAGLGLAARTELLARAGTVFARLLLHPPSPRRGCPLFSLLQPAFLGDPRGAVHLACRELAGWTRRFLGPGAPMRFCPEGPGLACGPGSRALTQSSPPCLPWCL